MHLKKDMIPWHTTIQVTVIQSGKALYVDLSNYDGPLLEKATAILDDLKVPFVINQNRYSIFDRTIENNGLKETSARLGKGIIAFSSLVHQENTSGDFFKNRYFRYLYNKLNFSGGKIYDCL